MVRFDSTDEMEWKDFELAWRITDPQWAELPNEIRNRIHPLSQDKSKLLLAQAPINLESQTLVNPTEFREIARRSLKGDTGQEQDEIRSWLHGLPIPESESVYIAWHFNDGVAVACDWKVVTEFWDDLWYPFDAMCVFDDTGEWAVTFGREEQAAYMEKNPDHPNLTDRRNVQSAR